MICKFGLVACDITLTVLKIALYTGQKKKPKKKGKAPARPKKKDSGSEAEEESDTGDFSDK